MSDKGMVETILQLKKQLATATAAKRSEVSAVRTLGREAT